MFFWESDAISWSNKKQPIVTFSSTEVENKGVIMVICEMVCLQKLFSDLRQSMDVIIVIYCDNSNSMLFANNSTYHIKTKHNETHYHFVRNKDLIKRN